jgi:septal ring factor EnvC (AmiA/AmiB activator)
MQEVASDKGMTPITGNTPAPSNDVGGLIAAVEAKMAELMAWHEQQTKQLETDKTVLEAQGEQQREQLAAERKQLDERIDQVNQQRIKLVELTSKLRAEETAMSREWAEVQRERESVQKRAADLAKQRERLDERAKAWLDTTASELSQPLKLTGTDDENDDETTDRHAA